MGNANDSSSKEITYVTLSSTGNGTTTASYIDGYSDNQQDVLLRAFYKTYTGRDIKNFSTTNIFPKTPLPNWTIAGMDWEN